MSTATPEQLRGVIKLIDALSQEAFSEIKALAKMAMASLETPAGYTNIEHLFYVLNAIGNKADDIEDCINREAEGVGCNHEDHAMIRRWDAQRKSDAVKTGTRVAL